MAPLRYKTSCAILAYINSAERMKHITDDIVRTFKIAGGILRFVILMPFIPFLILLGVYFGWIIGIARKIPEDLEDQVRCANAQIGEKRDK